MVQTAFYLIVVIRTYYTLPSYATISRRLHLSADDGNPKSHLFLPQPPKMPRGSQLDANERVKILTLHEEKLSVPAIAKRTTRSKTVIYNFLRNPQAYDTQNHRSSRKKMTVRDERRLLRLASISPMYARELKVQLELPISPSRVRSCLNGIVHLKYLKPKTEPRLTKLHKDARLRWAKKHVKWGDDEWRNIVFSDEKRLCCDGPDGLQNYWHDLRKSEVVLSR